MQVGRDVGDFVEEQRAALGHFKTADAVRLGVGESALHMTEQLALEDAFGKAAGVDREHRLDGPQRNRMQRLRHQSFAGAVLAGDQYVGIGRTHARDHVQDRLHGGGLCDQTGKLLRAQQAILGFQDLPFAQSAPQLDLGAQNGGEPRVVPRLLDEVAGAAAHSFHRQVHAAPSRHHDHRQRAIQALQAVEQIETFLARGGIPGVVQVHDHGVEVARFHGLQNAGRRVDGLGLIALSLNQEAQGFQHVRLVVGDQDPRHIRIVESHGAVNNIVAFQRQLLYHS